MDGMGKRVVMNYTFKDNLDFEYKIFIDYIKPYFELFGAKCIWINEQIENYMKLQKQDKDFILISPVGQKQYISLKVRKQNYKDLFFEVISNTNKQTMGWGLYSQADLIFYCVNCSIKPILYIFSLEEVRKINCSKYLIKYGRTQENNHILYETKGYIIPFSDIKHTIIEF